jgi:uncharacterized membrane protein
MLMIPMPVAAEPRDAADNVITPSSYDILTEVIGLDFNDPVFGPENSISLEDTHLLDLPGLPRVPFRTVNLEYPVGTTILDVKATFDHQGSFTVQGTVGTSPPAYVIGPDGPMEDIPIEMYYDGEVFPADWYTYDIGRGLNDRGEARIFVNIWAYPVRVEGTGPTQEIHHINELKIMVDHIPPNALESRSDISRDEQYDLILIGPTEFEDELQVLADHKVATGLKSRVVTLNDIYHGNIFPVQGRDSPEKVKYFIKDAIEAWGIEYVLLGGDIDKVPCRHTLVSDGFDDDGGYQLDGEWVLSDIYFGDIYNGNNEFSSWDENGNGTFGEWLGGRDGYAADDPDLYLDVYVGRFPASTASELMDMISKTINYENNTDWDWYHEATIAALDIFPTMAGDEGQISGDILADDLQDKGYTIEKLYEAHGTLSGAAINSAINDGVGIISMIGHGTFAAWGSNTTLYYENGYIDNLHNGVKLPVGSQASCLTGAFDNGHANYPGPANVDSMGEEFVLEADGGHIVNYGYSRVAYGGKGENHSNESSGYMNNVLFNAVADGYSTPGEVLNKARNDCIAHRGTTFVGDYKHMQMFHMFGDPSTALGGIGVSLETDDTTVEMDPGEVRVIDIKLKNTGAYYRTAYLDARHDSPWYIALGKDEYPLSTGQEETVPLTVKVDPDAQADEAVNITVTADSFNDRSSSITVQVMVNHTNTFNFTVPEDEISLFPGHEGNFELQIENTANGPEHFSLTLDDVPTGWDVVLNLEHFDVLVSELFITGLTVNVPEQWPPGTVHFNVTAMIDGTTVSKTIMLTVDVMAESGIALVCLSCGGVVEPGGEVEMELEVFNHGNIEEHLPVHGTLPDGWALTTDQSDGVIQPYSSEKVTVLVTASIVALSGDYPIELSITNGTYTSYVLTKVTVKEVRGLSLLLVSTDLELINGEMSTLLFRVNNTGNVPENTTIQFIDSPASWTTEGPKEMAIPPFSGTDVGLNITPAVSALAMGYDLYVQVSADKGLEVEEEARVTIAELARGVPSLDEDVITTLPGTTATGIMFYDNTGNIDTTLTLHPSSDDEIALVLMGDSITVAPGVRGEVPFKLKVSDDARAGPHPFHILIERDKGGALVLNGTLDVQQMFGLDVTFDAALETIEPGKRLNKKVTLTNTGNGEDNITIEVKGTTSKWATLSEDTVTLGAGESKVIYIDIYPPERASEGVQVLSLEMTYGTGDQVKESLEYEISPIEGPAPGLSAKLVVPVIIIIIVVLVLVWVLLRRQGPRTITEKDKMSEDDGKVKRSKGPDQ